MAEPTGFTHVYQKFGIKVHYVDTTEASYSGLPQAKKARLIWIESPTNRPSKSAIFRLLPTCQQTNALLVVDNTFASPVSQKPLELGADLVNPQRHEIFGRAF
ncbi:MAG: PLP-dependent transferase [Bacteroidia bacterium]